jgi:hypothetical protein
MEIMLRRIKRKNALLILLGIVMLTPLAYVLLYFLTLAVLILVMAVKVVGAVLVGYNAYYVLKQIKNDEEDEVPDED